MEIERKGVVLEEVYEGNSQLLTSIISATKTSANRHMLHGFDVFIRGREARASWRRRPCFFTGSPGLCSQLDLKMVSTSSFFPCHPPRQGGKVSLGAHLPGSLYARLGEVSVTWFG